MRTVLGRLGNQRADYFAASGPGDVAVSEQVADDDRFVLLGGQSNGCLVHDGDVRIGEDLVVIKTVKLNGVREFSRVFVIYAIDFRCFDHNVALHLEGEVESGGVGSQEGPASAAGNDDDTALLDMTKSAAIGVLVDKLINLDGGQGAGWQASVVEDISQGNGIH